MGLYLGFYVLGVMADFFGDADFEDVEGAGPDEHHGAPVPAPPAALNDLGHVSALSAAHAIPLCKSDDRRVSNQ